METEYEIKILDVDHELIATKLAALGATKVMERNMRRYVYDLEKKGAEKRWLRLRDDGEKVQLTIKEIYDDTITGTKEFEVVVDDFEGTAMILEHLGFVAKAYQENRRVSYRLDDVDVELDSWPKIPPYIEVEGKDETSVKKAVEKLGYTMADTTSIGVGKVYRHYGLRASDYKELKF